MARNECLHCQRPINACICAFIDNINNKTPVLVLQHPSEVKQSKGTVALLQRSLSLCQVLVGENFSENTELNKLITTHRALLLYPSEQAQDIRRVINCLNVEPKKIKQPKPTLLIIIDGTWRKAYRMFMLSKNLQTLMQVCLPEHLANNGQYLIRKVAKQNALSSLEATCYALALLDGELDGELNRELDGELDAELEDELNNNLQDKTDIVEKKQRFDCGLYQPLLNKFAQFNQFQLSFREHAADK